MTIMNERTMREIIDKPLKTIGNSSGYYTGPSNLENGCRTPREWPAFYSFGANQQDSAMDKSGYGDSVGGVSTTLYGNSTKGHDQSPELSMSRTRSKCPFGHTSTSAPSRDGQSHHGYTSMVGVGMVGRSGCYWKEMWKKLDIMRQLWQLCDVTLFSCDDAMFMAHSPVLAASSDVFHDFFVNHTEGSIKALSDRSMKLANVPRDVLQVTLDFIYGITPTTALDFEKLMSGARVLGLHGAAKYCQTQGYPYSDAAATPQDSSFKLPYEVPCSVTQHKNYLKDSHILKTGNHGKISQTLSSIQACSEQNLDENFISESIDLRIGHHNQNSVGKSMETFCEDLNSGIGNAINPEESLTDNDNAIQGTVCSMASPKAGTTVCKDPVPAVPMIVESPTAKKAGYPILPARKRDRPPKKSMELRDISFQEFLPDNHPDIMSDKLALNGRCPVLHGGGASLDPDDADEVLAGAPVPVLLDDCESVGTPQPESEMDQNEVEQPREKSDSLQRCPSPLGKAPRGFKHFPDEAKMESEESDVDNLTTSTQINGTETDVAAARCPRYGKDLELMEPVSSFGFKSAQFGPTPRSRGKPDVFDYASCPEWVSDNTVSHESDEGEQQCNINVATSGPYRALTSPVSSVADQSQYSTISNVNYSSSDGENSEDIHILDNCTDQLGRQPLTEEEKKAAAHENTKLVGNLNQDMKRRYMCLAEGCGYVNKHLDYLQSHMFHRHNLGRPDRQCEFCDHRYFSDGQLKTHVRRSHQEGNRTADSSHKACPDCGATFSTGYTLQMHLLKAHGKGRLFTCEDCEFKSPRKKDMQAHMLSQHNKYPHGVRVFSCQYCSYKCVDRNRYEEHEAKHTGEQKYNCDICGKSYTTRRGMRTHLKYHSEERPHVCEICLARFKVRSKLKDHVRLVHTHAGVKPYQCGYCQHATALRGNCNQHIKKYHPGKPVYVIDMLKNQRKHVKDYNYAKYEGDNIQVTNDVTAASWASIGNAANFNPPTRAGKGNSSQTGNQDNGTEANHEDMNVGAGQPEHLHQAISQAIQGSEPDASIDT